MSVHYGGRGPGHVSRWPKAPGTGTPTPSEGFVAPDGSGDGTSWADAASPADIAELIANPATTTINLRADDGDEYTNAISIPAVDRTSAPITIRGRKSDGTAAKALFRSNRTSWTLPVDPEQVTDVTGWTVGGNAFEIADGAAGLVFESLSFERIGAIFNFAGDCTGLTIHDIDAYNFRRFVEHPAGTDLSDVEIYDVAAVGFSKQAIKARGDSHNWHVHDVSFNSGRQSGDAFAVGFQISETAHDILIEDSSFTNCHDDLNTYKNGDGVSSEEDNYDITIRRVTSTGHTDAGFDLKSATTVIEDCTSNDNKKELRLWNHHDFQIIGGVIGPSHMRGGSGKPALVGSFANEGDGVTISVTGTELIEDGEGALVVHGVGLTLTSVVNFTDCTYDLSYLTKLEDYSNDSVDANCTVNYDPTPPVLPDAPWLNPNPEGTGAVAGSPGTQPTGWSMESNQNGLTRTIAIGADYIDMRFAGTTTSTTRIDTDFNLAGDTAAVVGDKIEAAIDMEIINGAGMASLTGTLIRLNEFDGSNVSLGSGTSNVTFQTARKVYSYKRTLQNASCASVRNRLEFTYPNATAIDVTFRIYAAGLRVWA